MWMIGDPKIGVLNGDPAEIAAGVFLPITSRRADVTVGDYEVTIEVSVRDRQPRCDVLTVRSRKGDAITATSLRELPVASIVEHVMLGLFGSPFRLVDGERVEIATQTAVEAREARLPRRDLMPLVVEAYRTAIAKQDRKPIQYIARTLKYEPSYISKLVSEARKEGYLGPARPGIAGEERLERP